MVSWGGSGSSRPSPIISQVKVFSTLPMPMEMLLLKLKSSITPFGDSALKCHRSMSLLLAIAIDGSVTVKLAAAAARAFVVFDAPGSRTIGLVLEPSGLVVLTSCVFNSVSTCSNHRCVGVSASYRIEWETRQPKAIHRQLTQTFLQRLDISPLRTAFPPDFIVGASVAESRASAAAWLDSIAFELPLPTYHTGQTLWFWDGRIAPRRRIRRRGPVSLFIAGIGDHDGVGRGCG